MGVMHTFSFLLLHILLCTYKTGPLERNSMSVCHQSKTDEDTFFGILIHRSMEDHFSGFLLLYESCMLVGSLGCYAPAKVTYQKVTIHCTPFRASMFLCMIQ